MGAGRADGRGDPPGDYPAELERATRGLLELNVAVLERMERRIGLAPLRALQSLQRLGPSMVTELGHDLDLLPSTASRLSDRLTEAGLISRRVAPNNRRATLLELTDAGRGVLDELVAMRTAALGEVAGRMGPAERDALLRGTHAFHSARQAGHAAEPRRVSPARGSVDGPTPADGAAAPAH